jgi:hypothetical protein
VNLNTITFVRRASLVDKIGPFRSHRWPVLIAPGAGPTIGVSITECGSESNLKQFGRPASTISAAGLTQPATCRKMKGAAP